MLEKAKVFISKPMSTGDSTLMMLLALNLLLLVFFMMLNSMATYGAKHAEDVLAQVREGYNVKNTGGPKGTDDVPETPYAPWRSALMGRMQGLMMNRLDLRVMPQVGNASKVEIVMPLTAIFDSEGKVVKPEFIRNMAAAAGAESELTWQVRGNLENSAKLAKRAAALAAEVGHAQVVAGQEESLLVQIVPGVGTKSSMGLQVQGVGENAGGQVNGVEQKGRANE